MLSVKRQYVDPSGRYGALFLPIRRLLNEMLNEAHIILDPATLHRALNSCGLMTWQADGACYQRVRQKPFAEAKAILHEVSVTRKARGAANAQR